MHTSDSRDPEAQSPTDGACSGRPHAHFQAFDGLRACAAGTVLAYHLGLATAAYHVFVVGPLISGMKAGVTIFFVISGFLLYLPYARAISGQTAWPSWRRFAQRRVARIVPGYWFALFVVAMMPVANDVFSANAWRYFGFLQIYKRSTLFGGLSVTWTVCVEMTFYALLPVLAIAIARVVRHVGRRPLRVQLSLIASLALASCAFRAALAHSAVGPVDDGSFRTVLATSLPGLFDWFGMGLLLAVAVAEWEAGRDSFRTIKTLARHAGACWVLAGLIFFTSVVISPLDLFLPEVGLVPHILFGLAAALFVLPAVGYEVGAHRAVPIRLLTSPVAMWLGTVSYGIYLWHTWLLTAVLGPLGAAAQHPRSATMIVGIVLLGVAAAVGLGAASWYLVERPAKRLLNGIHPKDAIRGPIGLQAAQRSSVT